MIVGITGKKNSGKDTAADYLVKKLGFTKIGFADKLKESFAALFDISIEDIERLKNDPDTIVGIQRVLGLGEDTLYKTMTLRTALQRYGVEAHRDIFGQDFWVEAALGPTIWDLGTKIVVPDVRFENEARAIHRQGVVIEIVRPGLEDNDTRVSETGLPDELIDARVTNDDTIERLQERVLLVVKEMMQYAAS